MTNSAEQAADAAAFRAASLLAVACEAAKLSDEDIAAATSSILDAKTAIVGSLKSALVCVAARAAMHNMGVWFYVGEGVPTVHEWLVPVAHALNLQVEKPIGSFGMPCAPVGARNMDECLKQACSKYGNEGCVLGASLPPVRKLLKQPASLRVIHHDWTPTADQPVEKTLHVFVGSRDQAAACVLRRYRYTVQESQQISADDSFERELSRLRSFYSVKSVRYDQAEQTKVAQLTPPPVASMVYIS